MACLTDFIQVHENAISIDTCNYLIDLFEQNPEYQDSVHIEESHYCTEFNLTKTSELSPQVKDLHNNLIRDVFKYRDEYYEVFNKNVFPEKHAFEQFKIKKYDPNDGYGNYTHVDVIDHETSRRYLSFFWFLSDNAGGQTEFLDLIIQPKAGSLLIFPPLWMFPYKEYEAVNDSKYILTTYLHYK